jgi:hypothetical protein
MGTGVNLQLSSLLGQRVDNGFEGIVGRQQSESRRGGICVLVETELRYVAISSVVGSGRCPKLSGTNAGSSNWWA